MRRVMIGTPSDDGRVEVLYTDSLVRTIKACLAEQIEILPVFIPYDAMIQRVRNELLDIAVQGKVDDLIFIDADQCWEPGDVLKLLSYPVDCVGAAVRKKDDSTEHYNVSANATIPIDPQTGLLMPNSVGTGFIRLSRKAMQALWETSKPYTNGNKQGRWVFEIGLINNELHSEDVIMCLKLRSLGIPVHLDPSINPGHIGPKVFKGDFNSFLQRKQQEANQQRSA